jgi:TrmH family RNA methyltransferase
MVKEITSTSNETVKSIKALLLKKGRSEQGRYLIEGGKIVLEALAYAPGEMRVLLVQKGEETAYASVIEQAEQAGAEVLAVSQAVLEAVSDVKTPQGVAAVMAERPVSVPAEARFLVALDGVSDPSNVGAVIRTADAAGADGVIVSEDSADIYSPKTLRAAMGSHFHIAVAGADLTAALIDLKNKGFTLYASHLKGEEDYAFAANERICVVIGSEARGIREEIAALCAKRIKIPIFGKAESLNAAVAAGILLYDIARARR